jgi:hypothetical protein
MTMEFRINAPANADQFIDPLVRSTLDERFTNNPRCWILDRDAIIGK